MLRALVFAMSVVLATATAVAEAAPVRAADTAGLIAARARQAQLTQIEAELGAAIVAGLATQQQLSDSLRENRSERDRLAAEDLEARARLAEADRRLAELDLETAALQPRIAEQRRRLNALARGIYVQPDSVLVELFSSSDLGDLVTRVADLDAAGSRVRAAREKLRLDETRLSEARRQQEALRRDQEEIRGRLQRQDGQLRELADRQARTLADLQASQAVTRAALAGSRLQSAATARFIADGLAAERAEIAAAASQEVWDQVRLLGRAPSPPAAGELRLADPLPGTPVTQGFGPSSFAFEPPFGGHPHFHTGIDKSGPAGTPVLAAGEGVVLLAGFNGGGYGNYVVVGHAGGYDTLYGHLAAIAVARGQTVARGQPLGSEGSTGNSTGPHLHFELRRAGQPVDPAPFLK